MAFLELKNIKKFYDEVEVINNLSLKINDGEFCVLVGPSGCGKSTLLRMIAGLEKITGGDIFINDLKVNDISAANRGLAMVFQSYALYPHMSVRQNLAFGLENLKMKKDEINKRIIEATRLLRMQDYLQRKPGQLSGGQKQRVAIGRAIVREPSIYLFDEPLSNLDAELRVATRVEIKALHKRLGNTMIYVTHDQVEAMTMADKIVVMNNGNIEQVGKPLDLYNKPENQFVAGFIGSPKMNFFNIATLETNIKKLAPRNAFTLGLRPEHLSLHGKNSIEFLVNNVEQLGADSFIYGKTSDNQDLSMKLNQQTNIRQNEKIKANFDLKFAHWFDKNKNIIL
tara:strand:+ start:3860 stop:4879 length:1020 start_codon:yes stop_codon:yes gene_type:complete